LGHQSTISYVTEVAKIVLEKTGLLPHINAGVMSREDVALLRGVSASQGLMLESISDKLLEPGGAHYRCPDKLPEVRLATIAAAGKKGLGSAFGVFVDKRQPC
jgi:FO synthase